MKDVVSTEGACLPTKAYAPPQLIRYGSVMHLTAAGSGNRLEDQGGQEPVCNPGNDVKKMRC